MAKVKKPIVTKKKPTVTKKKPTVTKKKPTVTKEKLTEQIQKPIEQKQNVTVNIGTTRAGKRTVNTKKKPQIQPPITVAPTFSPVFNKPSIPFQQPQTTQILQPNPQSILSNALLQPTQQAIKEDQTQTSALRKALGEQQLQTDEPVTKANDLERVRSKRTEKFDIKPPVVEVQLSTQSVLRSDEPVRTGILSQLLGDQQDDTEEIQALRAPTIQPKVPYELVERPDIPSLRTTGTQTSRFDSALRSLRLDSVIPKLKGETLPPLTVQPQLVDAPVEPEQPYPLGRTEQPTTAETFTETKIEPTPLSQVAGPQLGFGGITEEVQTEVKTSKGEFLPPAPVAQTELLRRQQQEPPASILEVRPPPPSILEEVEEVRPPDATRTEVLVKGDVPVAEARPLETRTERTQIKELWDQLVASGQLKASTKIDDRSRNKNKDELLADIRTVAGQETWTPKTQEVKNTGKTPKKATATLDV
jgi:hypothetical protein